MMDYDRADIGAPELDPDYAQVQAQAAASQASATAPVVIDDPVVPVSKGGTGANTAAGARTNLGAAASGANADITSLAALTTVNVTVNFQQGGTQVVGARVTGWGAAGGTVSRSAFTGVTVAGLPVGAAYSQAEVTAIRDAVVAISQAVAALITDLRAHGLIGT